MNEVGAKEKDKKNKDEQEIVHIKVHVGVFFDGTNNNANNNKWYEWFKTSGSVEKSHAFDNTIVLDKERKISNPAILSALYVSKSSNNTDQSNDKYLHLYIEGSGAKGYQMKNTTADFLLNNGKPVTGLGFGLGPTGVVAKVSKAITYISSRIEAEEINNNTVIDHIHYYVFGFSRGSACARLFSYIVARSAGEPAGILPKEDEFDSYLSKKYFKNNKVAFLENYKEKMTVDFLGIYDTVSAIGFLKDSDGSVNKLRTAFMLKSDFWNNFHSKNATHYGLYSPSFKKVLSTCHLCALDEFRANFALTDIGNAATGNNIELFLPGCHSDIGGGYASSIGDLSDAEKKTLKVSFEGKKTRMCVQNPLGPNATFEELNSSLLKKLGWIDYGGIEVTKEKKNDSIEFKHDPIYINQYSNLPLKFMYQRALSKAPNLKNLKLFSAYPEAEYPIPGAKQGILGSMWSTLEAGLNKNGRYCYIIGDGYSSPFYQMIRQHYLHFTSTDSLHSAGDLGNPPGRKNSALHSDICRLVYRGDYGDMVVRYMQQYNGLPKI